MSNETIAWKICYTENGQYRTVLSEHNSVGDYRAIDPMASSIALCASLVSAKVARVTDAWLDDHITADVKFTAYEMPGVYYSQGWRDAETHYQLAAPVTSQPCQNLTQQTLDDVMAGIPARDAEIEALRKQVETLQAQLVDRSPEMQGTPVDESPNLQSQQQPVSGADGLPALVEYLRQEADFNRSWADGRRGSADDQSPEYITRRLDLAARADTWADAVASMMATRQGEQPSGNSGELPSDDWLTGCVGVQNQGGLYQITGLADIRRFAECVLKHWGKQDADKVDAERWRAYRSSVAADDAGFLQRALNAFEAMGIEDGKVPSEDQIDAAIDAARKEQA